MLARMPALRANARRLLEAGVNMIAGTDAGIAPIKPPDVIRWAVPQFQQLGMTAAEALHACTARAATALGLGHRKGRLRNGYDADILAVDEACPRRTAPARADLGHLRVGWSCNSVSSMEARARAAMDAPPRTCSSPFPPAPSCATSRRGASSAT